MTSRHYCLTFYTKPTITINDKIRYAIYGEEICPKTKKVHWQSYIELFKPARLSAIKKIYDDNTIHCEPRRGTRDQARDYCMKDNKYEEYGKWIKGQGHRTDLESVVEELKNGKPLSELMIEQPYIYCQYRNGLKDIAAEIAKRNSPKWRDLDVTLITGPTGSGKTRLAMQHAEYRIQGTQLAWWQDYQGEDCICIDEYSNDVKITEMLNLLDGWNLKLNVKGSHTYANWTKVYITTNLKLHQIHSNATEEHRNALFRRINNIISHWPDNTDIE